MTKKIHHQVSRFLKTCDDLIRINGIPRKAVDSAWVGLHKGYKYIPDEPTLVKLGVALCSSIGQWDVFIEDSGIGRLPTEFIDHEDATSEVDRQIAQIKINANPAYILTRNFDVIAFNAPLIKALGLGIPRTLAWLNDRPNLVVEMLRNGSPLHKMVSHENGAYEHMKKQNLRWFFEANEMLIQHEELMHRVALTCKEFNGKYSFLSIRKYIRRHAQVMAHLKDMGVSCNFGKADAVLGRRSKGIEPFRLMREDGKIVSLSPGSVWERGAHFRPEVVQYCLVT